ncbi:glycosyltransferase family 2 protein [Streptomyces zagrosensis]|uniref:Glycosyltransferase involved in cell wall biosynthesis n=1 Tax=Streptomyces zagrosensis TaxID=1042984 RepID=A0A7W9QC21_9ACTN|nr:glycosyltransferase family A protein [Streptomyces zagrosensis]MBB5937164.1 glycosyltransferase involved in cell wall biosynthesis [Streptomyces zagrosensis]
MNATDAPAQYAVVIPTLGRPSLTACLRALAEAGEPGPRRVVLVDDRPLQDCAPLPVAVPDALRDRVEIAFSCGQGPAAARNTGWRAVHEPWVVFLDDDVIPSPGWAAALAADLAAAGPRTAAVTARIAVPLPADRRPTDWERGTAGLATARWITADMACRTAALDAVNGFDEAFRRAFREDADLALRLLAAGWEMAAGRRLTTHPVRPADRWVSVRAQAGNADDVLMTRRHGRSWWYRADAPRGRRPAHLAVTGAAVASVACALAGRGRAAAGCAALWAAGTAEFAWARVAPGPRSRAELATMVLTSPLIPPLASWHWLRGLVRHREVRPLPPGRPPTAAYEPTEPLIERV